MPKAMLKEGRIIVLKTVSDVNEEFQELVNQARNEYLDAQMMYAEQPEKIERARLTYKEILLRRQNELEQAVE